MGSGPLIVVLLALLAWPARALGAQDPDVLCGGECGCGQLLLRTGHPAEKPPGLQRGPGTGLPPAVALGLGAAPSPVSLLLGGDSGVWGLLWGSGRHTEPEAPGGRLLQLLSATPLPVSWL